MDNLWTQKEKQDQVKRVCEKNGYSVVYENIDQATEQLFKDIRQDWFGASDSSKLLNLNPFPNGSQDDLLKEKLTNIVDESIGKKASVRMGKDIEHIVIDKLNQTQEFYNSIIKPSHMYGDYNTHLSVNFDGVKINPYDICIPVEIKAVTKYGRKYYDFNKSWMYQKDGEWQQNRNAFEDKPLTMETAGIPVYYYTQLQQQIMFLKANLGYLAVIDVDNWDVHVFYIPKDEVIIGKLKKEADKLWTKIRTIKEIKEIKKEA